MSKFARRINDVIKFNEENKTKLLDFLYKHPIILKSIQTIMELNNDFDFDKYLLSVDSYEIYSYIKLKIISIFSKYFKNTNILDEDDLFFEIMSKYKDTDSHDRVKYLAEKINIPFDTLLYTIKSNADNTHNNFYFYIEFDENSISGIEILNAEINKIVNKFLSNFPSKPEFEISNHENNTLIINFKCSKDCINLIDFQVNYSFRDHKFEDSDSYVKWSINDKNITCIEFDKKNKEYSLTTSSLSDSQIKYILSDSNININVYDNYSIIRSNDIKKFLLIIRSLVKSY